MKYVQINSTSGAWSDSVVFEKHRQLVARGDESWVFWGRGKHEQNRYLRRFNTDFGVCVDWLQTHLDGRPGFHSKMATKRLLAALDEIDPDVVHLHVLTGYYINIEMLLDWLKRHSCKVNLTLHDCWDFTGHCIYFNYAQCDQWRTGCATNCACPQKREYPEAWLVGDAAVKWNYERKRELFTALSPERVQLITPSQWLADLVKQSYLGKYDVEVIHNVVTNDGVFKPTSSDFRDRYRLGKRFVVLGVASKWSERKGLKDFVRLARDLDSDRFAVVLIGLSKKQIKNIMREENSIIALPRTNGRQELAGAYSAADVLFNPTVEDNFPTVNLEAEACGTPVVTYDTGGCGETIKLEMSRVVDGYQSAMCTIKAFGQGAGVS